MKKSIFAAAALALTFTASAAEPTVEEVYAATSAGRYAEAQTLIEQVLKAHPNSGTAHFVQAELLTKQGKFAAARAALDKAEELSPGLPKVKPEALNNLRAVLARTP